MRPYQHVILDEQVTATTYSAIVDVQHLTFLSYQLDVLDGTLAGSINLQVSNDGVNFVDVSATSSSIAGIGTGITEVVDVCVKYVRVKITVSSGSSNVTVTMVNKGNS
jgi:hypothetical protein